MNAGKTTYGYRFLHVLFLAGWAVFLWPGCGEMQLNWQRHGSMSSATRPSVDRPATASRPAQQTEPAAPASAAKPVTEAPPAPQGDYLQLVISADDVSSGPESHFQYVKVQRVPPASAAEILRRLYAPIGLHGIERCVLIYAIPSEQKGAADFIRLLDATPTTEIPTAKSEPPAEAFVRYVAAYVGNRRPGSEDRKAIGELAPLFEGLARSEQSPAVLRWASAMLAGDIEASILSDFNRAEQVYLIAESQAPAGSVERLNAVYARARAQMLSGRRERAHTLYGIIVSQYSALRKTEPYIRARAVLDQTQGR